MLELDKIYNMDCIEGMKQIDDNSIDMILCDLPFGITHNKWDNIIDLKTLWNQYKRISKDNCAIVLHSFQPFTTDLINSNRDWFRYVLIWNKIKITAPMMAKIQPLRCHEDIILFYKKQPTYNPQPYKKNTFGSFRDTFCNIHQSENYGDVGLVKNTNRNAFGYPRSIIEIRSIYNLDNETKYHPTQKPLELIEYLINTYSNGEDIVLDNCMGSGTTAVACKRLNRHFIGFEISKEYCDIAQKRLDNIPDRLENWIDI